MKNLICLFSILLVVSCAHQKRYHVLTVTHDPLATFTLQRKPASFITKLDPKFKKMTLRCYTDPQAINLQDIYKLNTSSKDKKPFLLTLANCLRAQKNYAGSFHILRKFLALSSTQQEKEISYTNLLSISLIQGQFSLAQEFVKLLQKQKKLHPISNYNIALFYIKTFRPTKAEQYLKYALRGAKNDVDITLLLAQSYIIQHHYNQAIKILEILSPLKTRSDIAITKAYAYIKLNQLAKAKQLLTNIDLYINAEDDIVVRFLQIIDQTLDSKQDQKS